MHREIQLAFQHPQPYTRLRTSLAIDASILSYCSMLFHPQRCITPLVMESSERSKFYRALWLINVNGEINFAIVSAFVD